MARLLQLVKKRALHVAPEPEAGSLHAPQESSIPSLLAAGTTPAGQTRRWKLSGFWKTKAALGAGANVRQAPSRPKWSCLRRRLGRQDPAQEGSRQAGWIWRLFCGKHQQCMTSPEVQQEPSPCPVPQDLPATSLHEAEGPVSSTSSSAHCPLHSSSSSQSMTSEIDGHISLLPGSSEEEEDEEGWEPLTEETAHQVIMEQLVHRNKTCLVKDENEQLMFLYSVRFACAAAVQRGRDTLEPHCYKPLVVQRVVELMEEQLHNSAPTPILANSLVALSDLSTMRPALGTEQESYVLHCALHSVFTLETKKDTILLQRQHKMIERLLDAMLENLLEASPNTDRLHFILEHLTFWLHSPLSQERIRAVRCIAVLLQVATNHPGFDNSAEFDQLGQHMAELALFIIHPDKVTSCHAREAIYGLYEILLHRRGLTVNDTNELWCREWYRKESHLQYINTARVGEIFGRFFSEEQASWFLRTAVMAIDNNLLCVCQAGLLLTYGILGIADQLMGSESENVRAKVMRHLHLIRDLHQVSKALQGCLP